MIYTSTPRNDGFGAQFQNIIWDILYVKEFLRGDYVLTIPTLMEHNYNSNPNFIKELFEFMNLKTLFKLNTEVHESILQLSVAQSYDEIQNNFSNYLHSETMNKIRENFFQNKKNPFNSSYFNIALHIRHSNPHDHYAVFISDNQFKKMFENIQSIYGGENVRFHIYSQGSKENLSFLESSRSIFHIDESIQETFLGFAYADVLVMSNSSFSYLGAHFNKNKIYSFPFYHKLDPNWVIIP